MLLTNEECHQTKKNVSDTHTIGLHFISSVTETIIKDQTTEPIPILYLFNMYDTFSNKPYIHNFYMKLPVWVIQEIYEANKDFLGEDQYKEDLINASYHYS